MQRTGFSYGISALIDASRKYEQASQIGELDPDSDAIGSCSRFGTKHYGITEYDPCTDIQRVGRRAGNSYDDHDRTGGGRVRVRDS